MVLSVNLGSSDSELTCCFLTKFSGIGVILHTPLVGLFGSAILPGICAIPFTRSPICQSESNTASLMYANMLGHDVLKSRQCNVLLLQP